MPDMPEWVSVWWWLRSERAPQVLDYLPQQVPAVDQSLVMSWDDYHRYQQEWKDAKSPRFDIAKIAVPF